MPRKPDRMEVAAPVRKAMVENAPLYSAGARAMPVFLSMIQAVENPSSDPSSTKMKTEKKAMKTPMYLYSVIRNDVAPSEIASCRSAAFCTIWRGWVGGAGFGGWGGVRRVGRGLVGAALAVGRWCGWGGRERAEGGGRRAAAWR